MHPLNTNRPLKAVTERLASCRAVLEALDAFGDRLLGILGESLDPLLEDDEVTPFATQLALFRRKLIQDRERLVRRSRAYRDQRARASIARGQRNEHKQALNAEVVALRRAFAGLFDEDKLAELGFARRTPQHPVALFEQASHLLTHLRAPGLDLSGSRLGALQLDPLALTGKLASAVAAMGAALDELGRAERRAEALKLAQDEALADFNRSFVSIARSVESLCRLAGLDEVARRVRPSTRRPGVTERAPEAEAAPPGVQPSEPQQLRASEPVSELVATAAAAPPTAVGSTLRQLGQRVARSTWNRWAVPRADAEQRRSSRATKLGSPGRARERNCPW